MGGEAVPGGPEPALKSFGGEERVARPYDAIAEPAAPVSNLARARRKHSRSIQAINVGQIRKLGCIHSH
jgi:hypothetical protein